MRNIRSGWCVVWPLMLLAACHATDVVDPPPPPSVEAPPPPALPACGIGASGVHTDLISASGPVSIAGKKVSLAYVSLSPGAIPTGVDVKIANRVNGARAEGSFNAGGFDPVAIAAARGDTLVVTVTIATGTALSLATRCIAVDSGRSPHVVRTVPSAGETHVLPATPLTVVFSEPVRPPAGAMSSWLSSGGSPVPGKLATAAGDDVRIVFTPDEPLAFAAEYAVTIDERVASLDGRPLERPGPATFQTETPFGQRPNSITVLVRPYANGCIPPFSFCEPANTTSLTLDGGSARTFSAPGPIEFSNVAAGAHVLRNVSGHYGGPVICGFWFDDDDQELPVVLEAGKSVVVSLHFECF